MPFVGTTDHELLKDSQYLSPDQFANARIKINEE
jgi:hypothetical protein